MSQDWQIGGISIDTEVLNKIYEIVILDGLGISMKSYEDLTYDAEKIQGSSIERAENIILVSKLKSSCAAFFSGLIGVAGVAPNVLAKLSIHLRMVASIAYLERYNPKDPLIRNILFACLLSSSPKFLQFTSFENMFKMSPGAGWLFLCTKYDMLMRTGTIKFIGKSIPIVASVTNTISEWRDTDKVGKAAKDVFLLDKYGKIQTKHSTY